MNCKQKPSTKRRQECRVVATDDVTERSLTEKLMAARVRLHEFASPHSLREVLQLTLTEIQRLTGSRLSPPTTQGKGAHSDLAGGWANCGWVVHLRRPVIHNDFSTLRHGSGRSRDGTRIVRELVPLLRREKIVAVLGMGNKATDYNQRGIRAVTYLADVAWEIAERKRAEAGHGGLALLEATVRDETEGKQTAGHSRAKRPFKSKGAGNAR